MVLILPAADMLMVFWGSGRGRVPVPSPTFPFPCFGSNLGRPAVRSEAGAVLPASYYVVYGRRLKALGSLVSLSLSLSLSVCVSDANCDNVLSARTAVAHISLC